jgi:hypothetical protein
MQHHSLDHYTNQLSNSGKQKRQHIPRAATCAVGVRADVMGEAVLRVCIAEGSARAASSASSIARIAVTVSRRDKCFLACLTHSPLPDRFGPKLLPTVPVNVQVLPALFVHRAVAEAPTVRQFIARFSRSSGVVDAVRRPAKARNNAADENILNIVKQPVGSIDLR